MANFLSGLAGAAGLAGAVALGRQGRAKKLARDNAYRAKLGLPALEDEPAPIDKAITWVKDKFSSAPATPDTPQVAAPAASSEEVGLLERLKAGNIDQAGSEAYNRWGQGKIDGDAAELAREAQRTTPEQAPMKLADPVDDPATRRSDYETSWQKDSPDPTALPDKFVSSQSPEFNWKE